jgi:hypothetical protein
MMENFTLSTKENDAAKQETSGGRCAPTCYALRLYTYDYYEWQEDFAVSFDQELLKAHYAGLDHLYSDRQLVDASEHEKNAEAERVHWIIEPITFLHNSPDQPR